LVFRRRRPVCLRIMRVLHEQMIERQTTDQEGFSILFETEM
jgi:hypothetical protein